MGKQYTPDPNSKNERSTSDAIESLSDCVTDVQNELRHLVGQVCDVSQELQHIDAGFRDLKVPLLLIAAALADQTDSPSGSLIKEAIKKELRSASD